MANRLKNLIPGWGHYPPGYWYREYLSEQITVRELIRSRVYQEVKDFNTQQPEFFRGLIQPTETEQTLNGYKLRKPRKIR